MNLPAPPRLSPGSRGATAYRRPVIYLVLFWLVTSCAGPDRIKPPSGGDAQIYLVQKGPFYSGIDDVGILEATRSAGVFAPIYGTIQKMADEGTEVKEGDPVVWMELKDHEQRLKEERIKAKRNKSQLDKQLEVLKKTQFTHQQAVKERRATYEFDLHQLEMIEKELEQARARSEKRLIPESDVRDIEDDLDQRRLRADSSRIALERAEERFKSSQRTLNTDVEIAEKEYEQSTYRLQLLERVMEGRVLTAPRDGIVIHSTKFDGGKFTVGDRVYMTMQICEIPDFSEMKALSQIDEIHYNDIEIGQDVIVRINTLDDLAINGKITKIGVLAIPRNQSAGAGFVSDEDASVGKVFEIETSLDTTDSRLRPGMGVALTVIDQRIEDALAVPLSAVTVERGQAHVYRKHGDWFVKTRVETGPRNASKIVITDGVKEGDVLYLTPTSGANGVNGAVR